MRGGLQMLVPFDTTVVDSDGKPVGTVKHLVLHPQSRQVASLIVHRGILSRHDVVVPLAKVAAFGEEVRLTLRADELDSLERFHAPNYRVMPDHWEMPLGFDQREFFLIGTAGWVETELPFETTSPTVSGTPRFIADPVPAQDQEGPDITAGMQVYDSAGQRIGEVEAVAFDPASGQISQLTLKHGFVSRKEITIPASMIGAISDRIVLTVDAESV